MKTYITDIIPKLQRFSQKLDNLTLLTNQHWVVLDELESSKTVFIFRSNNELFDFEKRQSGKAKWEYFGNNSILIDQKDTSHLFKQGFFDENVLALKVDSKEEYAFLVNENRYDGEINSVEKATDFLRKKYLLGSWQKTIEIGPIHEIRKVNEKDSATIEPENSWSDKGAVGLFIFACFMILLLLILALT